MAMALWPVPLSLHLYVVCLVWWGLYMVSPAWWSLYMVFLVCNWSLYCSVSAAHAPSPGARGHHAPVPAVEAREPGPGNAAPSLPAPSVKPSLKLDLVGRWVLLLHVTYSYTQVCTYTQWCSLIRNLNRLPKFVWLLYPKFPFIGVCCIRVPCIS